MRPPTDSRHQDPCHSSPHRLLAAAPLTGLCPISSGPLRCADSDIGPAATTSRLHGSSHPGQTRHPGSSIRKSRFAEFYVSLLKRLCAPLPTRGIAGFAFHGWHHASSQLSDAIAASAVHRRWATRLTTRPQMGIYPSIEPQGPALSEVRASAPSAGGATARLPSPPTFAQGAHPRASGLPAPSGVNHSLARRSALPTVCGW